MRALVLGGTGTISSYIVKELIARGHAVAVLNHNQPKNLPDGAELVRCDRKNLKHFVSVCRSLGKFDCAFDMITYTPQEAKSSVEAFRGMADRVIFCSTVDVYDKSGTQYPVTERTPLRPRTSFPYAYDKAQCEEIYRRAETENCFEVVILRPAHTYSETNLRSHLIFHAFGDDSGPGYHLDRLRKGKPIILQGDGLSIWNATHATDIAHAFVMAMENRRAAGRAYTLAGDECMCYRGYWRSVALRMHAPEPAFVCIPTDILAELEPEKALKGLENYCFNNIFDTAAAKKDLGLRQTVCWDEGVRRCLAVYDKHGYEDCKKPEYAFYDRIIRGYQNLRCNLRKAYRAEL